jgi:hypothetical protein
MTHPDEARSFVRVTERPDAPGIWEVEAHDDAHEGGVHRAMFIGPDAKQRAHEHAERHSGQSQRRAG